MFDDDVWRYMPFGPSPSLAMAAMGVAAAMYVAVVRSRASRAVAVAVAMFVPIGGLVAVLSTRRPIVLGALCALLFSAAVEVGQMASGSFGDVEDLILNGLGRLLGAGAATLLRLHRARTLRRTAMPAGECPP